MKHFTLLATITLLSLTGCVTTSKNIHNGTYVSPNGDFSYSIPHYHLGETEVKDEIFPEGGSVAFYEWSHFKRIDYANFNPTVEREIREEAFRNNVLENFTMGTIVPRISQYVLKARVISTMHEEVGDASVFYVSMLMPKASAKTLNGERMDACRCMLTYSNGKRIYVFTVSAEVDCRDAPVPNDEFGKTEKRLKKILFQFFEDVTIL